MVMAAAHPGGGGDSGGHAVAVVAGLAVPLTEGHEEDLVVHRDPKSMANMNMDRNDMMGTVSPWPNSPLPQPHWKMATITP